MRQTIREDRNGKHAEEKGKEMGNSMAGRKSSRDWMFCTGLICISIYGFHETAKKIDRHSTQQAHPVGMATFVINPRVIKASKHHPIPLLTCS